MPNLSWQLEYMYGLERFGIKLGLGVMKSLVKGLGKPQETYPAIHIAGTNGKGSTAILMANALTEAGYKTGLYTSPHLVTFNERIRVNGNKISDEKLSRLIERVQKVCEQQEIKATFFEFTTSLALTYFAEEQVDISVIETGMGGRLDATNVVHPIVSVITNIGHDHMTHLGDTLEKVAGEKAGIIKPGAVCVTGETDKALTKYFGNCYKVPDYLTAHQISAGLDGQTLETHGMIEDRFSLRLLGRHQVDNALTALTALHFAKQKGFSVPVPNIQKAFAITRWPGRLDVIRKDPLILIDGAHNPEGAEALYNFLTEEQTEQQSRISLYGTMIRPRVLMLGVKKDKDLEVLYEKIAPMFEWVIVTEGNFEPMPAKILAEKIRPYNKDVEAIPNVQKALAAGKAALAPGDMMLITGSLYMIGDVMGVMAE